MGVCKGCQIASSMSFVYLRGWEGPVGVFAALAKQYLVQVGWDLANYWFGFAVLVLDGNCVHI